MAITGLLFCTNIIKFGIDMIMVMVMVKVMNSQRLRFDLGLRKGMRVWVIIYEMRTFATFGNLIGWSDIVKKGILFYL